MELNILIEGDDNRQMVADSLGRRLSKSAPFLFDAAQFANNLEALNRKIAKPDTIQFDNVSTPEVLADCVVALRDYRLSVVKLVVGVFVCAPGVIVLSNRVPIVIEGHADAEQEARLREQVAEMGSSALGSLLVKEDAIKFEGPGEDVVEEPDTSQEPPHYTVDELRALTQKITKRGHAVECKAALNRIAGSGVKCISDLPTYHYNQYGAWVTEFITNLPVYEKAK